MEEAKLQATVSLISMWMEQNNIQEISTDGNLATLTFVSDGDDEPKQATYIV